MTKPKELWEQVQDVALIPAGTKCAYTSGSIGTSFGDLGRACRNPATLRINKLSYPLRVGTVVFKMPGLAEYLVSKDGHVYTCQDHVFC